MSPDLLGRIEASYALLAPRLFDLTAAFYQRLFAARPDLRGMFESDLTLQQRHLGAALELIARNLRLLDALEGPLRQLGADHALAGVRPEDYPPVLDALVAVIGEALGEAAGAADPAAAWAEPSDVEATLAGWRTVLGAVAALMLAGGEAAGVGSGA